MDGLRDGRQDLEKLSWISLTLSLLLICGVSSVDANNGAVAYARPLSNISVDGDFSDWPADFLRYPIEQHEYGSRLQGAEDFSASFMVGSNRSRNCIYLAIEIADDSIVGTTSEVNNWKNQDGCSVFLGTDHGESGSIGEAKSILGHLSGTQVESAIVRENGIHRYEWRLQCLPPEGYDERSFTASFDVVVNDRDDDGSLSVVMWGAESSKSVDASRFGDLVIPAPDSVMGRIDGEISNEKDARRLGPSLVRIQSLDDPLCLADVETDGEGRYSVQLPLGSYSRRLAFQDRSFVTALELNSPILEDPIDPGSVVNAEQPLGPGVTREVGSGLNKGSYQSLGVNDGLPEGAMCFAQDNLGRLWIGARTGLARLDGTVVELFGESSGLPNKRVEALAYHEEDNLLWIGTANGVARLDLENFRLKVFGDTLGKWVKSIECDKQGRVYAGTLTGLVVVEDETCRTYSMNDGLASNRIYAVDCDAVTGNVWLGTSAGVYLFNGKRAERCEFSDQLEIPKVVSLLSEADGTLWIGTGSQFLRYRDKELEIVESSDSRSRFVRGISRDSYGNLWIGCPQNMRSFSDTSGSIAMMQADRKLINGFNDIQTLFRDGDGTIWVGSVGDVSRFYSNYTKVENRPVKCLTASIDGSIWYASRVNGGGWKVVQNKEGETTSCSIDFEPLCLWSSGDEVLAGGYDGAYRMLDGRFVRIQDSGWPRKPVQQIVRDTKGHLWIASDEGLHVISDDDVSLYGITDELHDTPLQVSVDSTGRAVVWTQSGVVIVDHAKRSVKKLTRNDGLTSDFTFTAFFDSRDVLWIGTNDGVQSYANGVMQSYTDNLNYRVLSGMEDSVGHLWFVGERSVTRYDGTVFQELDVWERSSLSGVDKLVASDGSVWLGGDTGLFRYRRSLDRPAVVVDRITTNEPLGSVREVETDTSKKQLEFSLHAVSLKTAAEHVLFRYRLAGWQEAWQYTNKGEIRFSSLPYGAYTFEVEAIDSDLNYSECLRIPVVVSFSLKQVAYRVSLFVSSILVIGSIGFYMWRSHSNQRILEVMVKERTAELEDEIAKKNSAEQQLRQAQKMEAVGTLAGGIAHDFNNLLTGISGNLAVAQLDPENASEHVSAAESAARRASELVKQLLGFTRKTEMNMVSCEVNEIIVELRRLLRHSFDSSIEFEWNLTENLPPISADSTQIEQVLLNLCCNARDALMEHAGKIEISTRLVPDSEHHQHQIEISIRDNGSGMSPEVQEKIFEPFFTTKDQGKGTGLGLAMSYGIVQQHRGELTCESTPGEGATFRIVLPALPRKTVVTRQIAPTMAEVLQLGGDYTVLVVDDESVVRAVASGLLRRSGYHVITADCGQAALELLEDEFAEIDAIILDVTMPGMSGKEVLVRVFELYPDLPVIICSGYLLSPDELEAETGVRPSGTVQKPYELRVLLEALKRVVEKDPTLSA
ncbi:MAG: signal transduction histidine kinase [Verrucomicrobiales bacterium]|jgi:signal transduction histidine kinase